MADIKISAATADTTITGTEEIPVNDGGVSKKITTRGLAAYTGDAIGNQYFGTAQALTASATTYLSGSGLTVPTGERVKNTSYARWQFQVHKTAAGTVAPSILVKWGTLGTNSDATLATLTFANVGTAVIDEALIQVACFFRSVGAGTAAVVVCEARMWHNLSATGWAVVPCQVVAAVVSSGFNSDVNLSILGLAMTLGASYVVTMTSMTGEFKNL